MRTALLFTPIPSPFLEQPYKLLQERFAEIRVVPVFYGKASHRPTWGDLKWEGIHLSGNLLARIHKIKKIWMQQKPDLVICSQYMNPECWLARILAQREKVPYYMAFVEPFKPSALWKTVVKRYVFKTFASNASGLGVMGRRAHLEYGELFKGPIVDTPYTFDYFEMLGFDDSFRPKDKIAFLYSGRLVPFRDPLGAIRAFASLHEKFPGKVELIISGKGELEQSCLSLVEELKISQSVRWMNDFKDWQDLRNLYRYAHVLLSLGKYNTWNLTIGEAMAAGMGVVATRSIEAANSLIIPAYNGFLVHHGDMQDTVRQMENYVEDPTLISKHASRSREIIKTIGLNEVTQNLYKLISRVIS